MGTKLKRYNGTTWVEIDLDASTVGGYTPSALLNYNNLTNKPDIYTKTEVTTLLNSYATKDDIGDINSILDTLNGEVV